MRRSSPFCVPTPDSSPTNFETQKLRTMKSTFSVIYYLKRQVVKKDGTVPVMGRITVDGSQTQFSCKLTVDPKLWIPQLQEIAGKVWKKEDELKQLKSELAALDRKIQLELAPPTPEVAEKENEGQQLKPEAEDVRNRQAQYPENAPPQIRSPADSIVANHVIIGRPGLYAKEETRSKGLKI